MASQVVQFGSPKASTMKALKLVGVWLFIVVCGVAYGRLGTEKEYLSPFESMLLYGAIGVGTASCAVVGLIILAAVRSRGLGKVSAILMLLASSTVSAIVPLFIVRAVEGATPRGQLFHGEAAGWASALIPAIYMFWIAYVIFLIFTVCVLRAKRLAGTQEKQRRAEVDVG